MKNIWLSQRTQLQHLAENEGMPVAGLRGKLRDALDFAESLTLVPNSGSDVRLLRDNRIGALSFLEVAHNLTETMETGIQQPSTSGINGPFHELADLALEFLNDLRHLDPSKFD